MAPYVRYVSDYPDLVEAVRDRFDDMRMTRMEIDRIAGLSDGYAGKVLTRSMMKTLGLRTLGPVLQTAGLIMVLLEDPAQRDRTLARREARQRPVRHGAQIAEPAHAKSA
jgi:hypothetical protein